MKRSEFSYELPEGLIAQRPLADRSASRLLCVAGETGAIEDRVFAEFPSLLREGDLLVFNDTRVVPARLLGQKETGGRIEALIERVTGEFRALAQLRASKSPAPGTAVVFDGIRAEVVGREGDLFDLRFDEPVVQVMDTIGHIPLPPYIRRPDDDEDRSRYQTVYATNPGAVAAPTAGLHFTESILTELERRGVERRHVTLHVGAGTFQPMRTQHVESHRLHSERIEVGEQVVSAIERTRSSGGRVVAVGTTSVRALEAAARQPGGLAPMTGETELFIYPGARFAVVDALLTNFHLPESTLLMLVCAFAGYHTVMQAYRHAVDEEYRFFSYGDAMFLTAAPSARGA